MARHGASASPKLMQEAREFWSMPSPPIVAIPLALAVAIRLYLGAWTVWDAVILAVLVALEPFVEWLIHVYVLHWKPREILGKTRDPYIAKKHRMHHSDPRLAKWIFVPKQVLYRLIPGA